jgi:hypothetical protein
MCRNEPKMALKGSPFCIKMVRVKKNLKNKICCKMNEGFDLNEAYLDVID